MYSCQPSNVPLCVDSDQSQFLPTFVHHILHAKIQFAAHDGCVWFSSECVEMLETDAIDLVVDI